MEWTFSLEEIKRVAAQVYGKCAASKVWAVHGEMGAGKTTFIHALCDTLGVSSAISSPTYSIINEYTDRNNNIIYHMDWYRLKDEDEALQAGVEDATLSGHFCLIEWVERAPGLLPDGCIHLYLSWVNEHVRRLALIPDPI